MNWNPLIWILAVVAIVLIVLLLVGTLHSGAITGAIANYRGS